MPRSILPIFIGLLVFSAIWPGDTVLGQQAMAQVEFKKCWQFGEANTEFVALSSDSRAAFVSTEDARVTSVALESGEKLWSSDLGGSAISNIVVIGERLYIVAAKVSGNAPTASLKVLNKETGIVSKELGVVRADRYFAKADNGSLILVSSSGDIYSVNVATDQILWHRKPTGSIDGKPYIGEGNIVISSTDKKLIRIDSKTGEIDLTEKLETQPTVVFSSRSGSLFYGDGRGSFASLTRRWSFKLGAQVSEILELDTSLIVTSHDNFVYRINAGNGDVRWRKRMGGRIAGVSVAADNSLLIFTLGEATAVLTEFMKGRTLGQMAIGEAIEAAVIPPTFASGSVISVNGDVFSFATAACESKKASAKLADASSNLPIMP